MTNNKKNLTALGLAPLNRKAREMERAASPEALEEVQAMQTIAGCTSRLGSGSFRRRGFAVPAHGSGSLWLR